MRLREVRNVREKKEMRDLARVRCGGGRRSAWAHFERPKVGGKTAVGAGTAMRDTRLQKLVGDRELERGVEHAAPTALTCRSADGAGSAATAEVVAIRERRTEREDVLGGIASTTPRCGTERKDTR